MRESSLWKVLSRVIPQDCMADRIENSVSSGMPDTLITGNGRTALIELKAVNNVKRHGITKKQADWHRRWNRAGGTSYVLIAAGVDLYLVPGCMDLLRADFTQWQIKNCREAIERILGIEAYEPIRRPI